VRHIVIPTYALEHKVGRCRLTLGLHGRPRACFQHLKLKYEKALSNFACFGFNCNVRPCNKVYCAPMARRYPAAQVWVAPGIWSAPVDLPLPVLGGAVQVHPGFPQLNPRLVSTLDTA